MTSSSDVPAPGEFPHALLLLGGSRAEVAVWASRCVAPIVTVPAQGWTIAIAAGDAQVGTPYDDAAMLLAARPVPVKAAPALGFFQIDDRAVLTVHGMVRPRSPRWVVWEQEIGLLRPPGLDLAGPAEIARLAGCSPAVRDELVDLLHEARSRPLTMLQAIMATLSLPGARLLADPRLASDLPGAIRYRPASKEVGFFEDAVADSVRLRRELGLLP
ncbi:MAG: hypothetical protein Q4P07_05245 [Ornithinimicrobium sp.]|uniref:hypothetical protein n=1 Tax=Ornithinimicrobium sp. TaxID=1977084 RepID=UPI0026E067EE|nr:hypothetical protein [Ornithinimicrobium sp.]MDO5739533.1 hypothetical protein [Ornithinimicrobium sp.]